VKLNALPHFITEIDGLDIHFVHVRPGHDHALPLIVTHGWPGSVIEQLEIVGPLTDPTAHGAAASDAFGLVIPSLPGYGYSGKPASTGWDPARIARAWVVLMQRLGYPRFASQGGDWGGAVTNVLADAGTSMCGQARALSWAAPIGQWSGYRRHTGSRRFCPAMTPGKRQRLRHR
jgi:pimeloyl-ACP methyl ester carboxylesterase